MSETEYQKPSLRISATYAATDGSAPESIEVEYGEAMPETVEVIDLIQALAEVPRRRYEVQADDRPVVDLPPRRKATP